MGDIVNLRRARKAKARQARQEHAAEKRVRFGTRSDLRTLETKRRAKSAKALDDHRREVPDDRDQSKP